MSKPSAIIPRYFAGNRAAQRWTYYADWFYRPRRGGGNRLFTGAASPGDVIDRCQGYDLDCSRALPGIQRCSSLSALLAEPLDTLFITTSSLQHLPVLERALASGISRIVVEKPIVANLEQAARLRALLAPPEQAARVLALDHWMARGVALNAPGPQWRAEGEASRLPPPHLSAQDIVWLEGYLQEPSGFNSAGEPVALNFATGELDTRQLRHPDGVILDIGTHVLAMLRETLHASGGDTALSLSLRVAKDRLGHDIAPGDTSTAEGRRICREPWALSRSISGSTNTRVPRAGKRECG